MTPSVEPQPISVTSASAGPDSFGGWTAASMPAILRMRFSIMARRLCGLVNSSLISTPSSVVLVGGDHVDVAGHAGNGARRDAAFGDLVALVAVGAVAVWPR